MASGSSTPLSRLLLSLVKALLKPRTIREMWGDRYYDRSRVEISLWWSHRVSPRVFPDRQACRCCVRASRLSRCPNVRLPQLLFAPLRVGEGIERKINDPSENVARIAGAEQ